VALEQLVAGTSPVSLAGSRVLPVAAPLEPLLPDGLRRGSVVAVEGSTSLALAVLAGPSAAGSWCAAVGLPSLGLVAAAELGVALERLALVASPGAAEGWATVVAALVDAMDVVLVRPPAHLRPGDARRLAARARERGAVLVAAGRWSERTDVRLRVTARVWEGLGLGHGRLRARRVDVVAEGRGAAARPRLLSLWLPGPGGELAAVDGGDRRPAREPASGPERAAG